MSKSRAGLAALALSGLAVLGLQAPASAAVGDCPTGSHYNPSVGCTANGASVDHRNFTPGGKGRLRAEGLRAGSRAALSVESTPRLLGNHTANGAGVVNAQFTLPSDLPAGEHHLVLRGTGENGAAIAFSVPITVQGGVVTESVAAAPISTVTTVSGSSLPYTGGEVGLIAVAGVALVAAGSGVVVAGRRRRVLV